MATIACDYCGKLCPWDIQWGKPAFFNCAPCEREYYMGQAIGDYAARWEWNITAMLEDMRSHEDYDLIRELKRLYPTTQKGKL